MTTEHIKENTVSNWCAAPLGELESTWLGI